MICFCGIETISKKSSKHSVNIQKTSPYNIQPLNTKTVLTTYHQQTPTSVHATLK